jgi:hypothetical protein
MAIQQGSPYLHENSFYPTFFLLCFQGYEYREAVDGHEGVCLFETDGHFEYVFVPFPELLNISDRPFVCFSVILLDLSMPILDGRHNKIDLHPQAENSCGRLRRDDANQEDRGIKVGRKIFLHPRSYGNVFSRGQAKGV